MKKSTKTLLLALCVVLLIGAGVMGTLAYMTESSPTVTNTFIAAKNIIEPDEPDYPDPYDPTDPGDIDGKYGFFLLEHEAEVDDYGNYELSDTDYVIANSYTVAPGMTLPKDPVITTHGKTETPAYLFIEVVDEIGDDLSYSINTTNWTLLTGVVGPNGGDVYVYTTAPVTADLTDVEILTDNEVTIDADVTQDALATALGESGSPLTFYGYFAQCAGFEDATEAFTTCWPEA